MSTILKALRRLERERAQDADRPLREEIVFSRPRTRGPWPIWALLAAALVLGFAATRALLPLLAQEADSGASTAAAIAPAPVAAPGPAAASLPPRAVPFVPPPSASVAAPAPVAPPLPPMAQVPPEATPNPLAAPPGGSEPQPLRSPPNLAPPTGAVAVTPAPGRASRLVDEEPVSRRARAELPVHVVRTRWHPRPDRRAAWVAVGGAEPREVREGEWVGAFEVRTIEPDGILFADGPLLVQRRVGER